MGKIAIVVYTTFGKYVGIWLPYLAFAGTYKGTLSSKKSLYAFPTIKNIFFNYSKM